MVKVVKSEWHQVEKVYGLVIDIDLLQEIYPDKEEQELQVILDGIEDGTYDLDDVFNDAYENDVEIDWDYLDQDDWWTDRKGGYEVTYKVEDWNHTEPYEVPKTHKCTKCKWTGQSYDAEWCWTDLNGNEIEDPRKICPYCESATELTEAGIQKEKEEEEWRKKWEEESQQELDEEIRKHNV